MLHRSLFLFGARLDSLRCGGDRGSESLVGLVAPPSPATCTTVPLRCPSSLADGVIQSSFSSSSSFSSTSRRQLSHMLWSEPTPKSAGVHTCSGCVHPITQTIDRNSSFGRGPRSGMYYRREKSDSSSSSYTSKDKALSNDMDVSRRRSAAAAPRDSLRGRQYASPATTPNHTAACSCCCSVVYSSSVPRLPAAPLLILQREAEETHHANKQQQQRVITVAAPAPTPFFSPKSFFFSGSKKQSATHPSFLRTLSLSSSSLLSLTFAFPPPPPPPPPPYGSLFSLFCSSSLNTCSDAKSLLLFSQKGMSRRRRLVMGGIGWQRRGFSTSPPKSLDDFTTNKEGEANGIGAATTASNAITCIGDMPDVIPSTWEALAKDILDFVSSSCEEGNNNNNNNNNCKTTISGVKNNTGISNRTTSSTSTDSILYPATATAAAIGQSSQISVPRAMLLRWKAAAELLSSTLGEIPQVADESRSLSLEGVIKGDEEEEALHFDRLVTEPPPLPPHVPVEVYVSTDAELEAIFKAPRLGWRRVGGASGEGGIRASSASNKSGLTTSPASSARGEGEGGDLPMELWSSQQALRVYLKFRMIPTQTSATAMASGAEDDKKTTNDAQEKEIKKAVPYALLSMPTILTSGRYVEIIGISTDFPADVHHKPKKEDGGECDDATDSAAAVNCFSSNPVPIVGSFKVAKGSTLILRNVSLTPTWAAAKLIGRGLLLSGGSSSSSSSASPSPVVGSPAPTITSSSTMDGMGGIRFTKRSSALARAIRKYVGVQENEEEEELQGATTIGTSSSSGDVLKALEAFWARNPPSSTEANNKATSLNRNADTTTPLTDSRRTSSSVDLVSSIYPCVEVSGVGASAYVSDGSVLAGGRDGLYTSSGGRGVVTGNSIITLCLRGVFEGHRCSALVSNGFVFDNKFQFVLLGTHDPLNPRLPSEVLSATVPSPELRGALSHRPSGVSPSSSSASASSSSLVTLSSSSSSYQIVHTPFVVEQRYLLGMLEREGGGGNGRRGKDDGGGANNNNDTSGISSSSSSSNSSSSKGSLKGNVDGRLLAYSSSSFAASSFSSPTPPNKVHKYHTSTAQLGLASSHIDVSRQRERMRFLSSANHLLLLGNFFQTKQPRTYPSLLVTAADDSAACSPLSCLNMEAVGEHAQPTPTPLTLAHFCFSYNPVADLYQDLFGADGGECVVAGRKKAANKNSFTGSNRCSNNNSSCEAAVNYSYNSNDMSADGTLTHQQDEDSDKITVTEGTAGLVEFEGWDGAGW